MHNSVNTLNDGDDDDVLFAQDMNFMNIAITKIAEKETTILEECNERSGEQEKKKFAWLWQT